MKKFILLNLIILLLSFSSIAQTIEWVKAEPYSSFVTWTNIVVHDKLGNSFISGEYNTSSSGGTGIFIIKYDPTGNKLWEKHYSGNHVSSMCTDTSGNLYTYMWAYNVDGVNYPINHGALFAKYGPNGNLLWIKQIPYALMLSERTDAQDNLVANGYIAGYIEDTVHLENGVTLTSPPDGHRLFIARYNTNGECLWAIEDEGGNRNIICNANAEIYIKAEIGVDSVILGKGLKQITLYSSNGLTYIAKYASAGDLIWAKQVNSYEIAPDNFGNLYSFSGDANGNTYLDKYDVNGNLLWKRTHLFIADWYKSAMKCNTNGDIYITGGFRGLMTIGDTTITGNGHYHVFVAKIDSSGTLKWITTTAGTGGAGTKDITIANGNEIYITGDIGGVNTFGTITINEPSGVFAAKIIDYDVSTTKINDFPKPNTHFNVYPNPSGSVFNIQYENKQAIGNLLLDIKNVNGNSVYKELINDFNGKIDKQINLNYLVKGTYFIEITSGKLQEVEKVVIE